ncbi:MAG: DUF362 domain-containing protein [Oscillospiraceae bacterium]
MVSKVYFCDMRASDDENLLEKLRRLVLTAKIKDIDFSNKYTAIKLHFGEEGNLSYLRHNYARVIADIVKEQGGKVFLTDCNTLYVGSRTNALDHLDCASLHGYNPLSVGCNTIIADGLKGTDETLVPINLEYVKEAKIGTAIMDADIFISLTHFKGHEGTGFGGALKNIGMGCGSRAGKMEMHTSGKPKILHEKCVGCGACQKTCAHGAITLTNRKATIDTTKCVGCGRCIGRCVMHAVKPTEYNSGDLLNKRMAEYAYAVVNARPQFHISLVVDVSPNCDCHSMNDVPIVPNIGMFASFDAVALDRACVDACNAQPIIKNSVIGGCEETQHDHTDRFTMTHPDTDWRVCLDHAEKIGLGTQSYELVKI